MSQFFKKKYVVNILLILFLINCTIGWCNDNPVSGNSPAIVYKFNRVPFEFINRLIVVKTKINNSQKEYNFMVDTGAGRTIINKQILQELGNKPSSEIDLSDSTNASQKVGIINLDLTVGRTTVTDCSVGIVDDLDLLDTNNIKTDGIIGNSFLKFFLVKIDYDKKELIFSRNTANKIESTQREIFHLTFEKTGLISTPVKIGKNVIQAIIDTGATGPEYLQFPIKDLEKIKPQLNCILIKSIGAGVYGLFSQSETIYSRLRMIELGGVKLHNVPVQFSNSNYVLITNAFLSHYVVTINYPRLEMALQSFNNKPFKINILTFGFYPQKDKDGRVKIIGIFEGSPAEKAGLKVGDEIVSFSFNNINVAYENIGSYMSSDNNQDVTLCMQVVNNSGKREVLLKKSYLLPEL
jgi:predicted aspartyl protease